jgi:hypothetical protein
VARHFFIARLFPDFSEIACAAQAPCNEQVPRWERAC